MQIRKLKDLNVFNATTVEFLAERARGAYISAICLSDATCSFSAASQIFTQERKDFQVLDKAILRLHFTAEKYLMYVALDLNSLIMPVFFDAVFGSKKESSS